MKQILKKATPVYFKGYKRVFINKGGYEKAIEDFLSVKLVAVRNLKQE